MTILVFYSEDTGRIFRYKQDSISARKYCKEHPHFVEANSPPPEDAYVDLETKEIKEVPFRPSAAHNFNYETEEWVLDLEQAKHLKWSEIKAARNDAEFGGFAWAQYTFDSDQLSQQRIASAVQLALLDPYMQIEWTLADNSTLMLTGEQLVAVAKALAEHVTSVHERGRILRDKIMCCESSEQLEVITWQDKHTI